MGDENPIRTLGDYSKPSHEGYKNTIELPVGNNVVPLRSDTIRNWLERLPAGSITTWEDLTTRFLAQFFPLGRTAKLHNDILMFQQHHGESLSKTWTRFKDLLQKVPHHGILRDINAKESWALLEDLALYDNESWNDPRDFAKPVKAIALPQDVPSTSDRRLIELENQVQRLMEAYLAPTQPVQVNKVSSSCKIYSGPHDAQYCIKNPEQASVDYTSWRINEVGGGSISVHSSSYQMKLEKALLDFDSNQEKRLSHLRTQLKQQQDDMIGKINLLWKTVSEKLNNVSTPENIGNPMAPKSIAAINHDEMEELRKKGIKSPSKLLSPKYLSLASIKELNKNPSAPKCVHFVNLIVILSTDSDTEEEDDSSTNACDLNLGEEESEFETDEEVEEIIEEEEDDGDGENFNSFPTMVELTHHEWLLKNPRPPWVKERIRAGSPNNIKISCMIGHFFKRHAYINLKSPINIMSRRQYNQIMTYGLRSRQKPSNPNKISNFIGRIKGLKIFIGSFAYECDFMILEDTTSIIDRHLGEMVFGRPFIEGTGLVYNDEEGTVMFKQDDEKITFKMPHTMKIFKQIRLIDEYKQDEGDRRGIRNLIRLEKEMMDNKGEVTYGRVTSSLATRLVNKEKRFLGGNPIYFSRN
ncbi:MAK10-like protein [Tanacetum coccineum]